MLIPTLLVLLNLGVFIVSVSLIAHVFPIRHWPLVKWLILLLGTFCIISFSTLNVYVNGEFESKVFFSRLRFIGLGLVAPAWVLFLSSRFRIFKWIHNRWTLALILLPGILTSIFTLHPRTQDLVVKKFSAVEVAGLSLVKFQSGVWFPYHYGLSIGMIMVAFVMGAVVFYRGHSLTRRQVFVLMLGSFISLGIDILCVATGSDWRWAMLSAGTFMFTVVAIALGVYRYRFLASALLEVKNIYMNSPDPVVLLDADEKIIGYNPAAAEILEMSPTSIDSSISRILGSVPTENGELKFTNMRNEERHFECVRKPLHPTDSLGSLVFFKDVTTYVNIRKGLVRDQDFRSRLMTLIAHDMFGHVQNQVRLSEALRGGRETGSDPLLESMYESATVSKELMKNLLEWGKTQSAGFEMVACPFEVNVLVDEVCAEVEGLFQAKQVRLVVKTSNEPLISVGDSQMIGSSLRNLLTNSLKATSQGQNVSVEVSKNGQTYSVAVRDNGVGLTAEDRDLLLSGKPLSTRRTHRSASGFGIGFSMVRHFVTLHKGRIEIESTKGEGTCVTLVLPLKEPSC